MMTELGTGLDLERLAVRTARTLPEEYWRNRWGPVFRALMGILAEGRPAAIEELAAASGTPASQPPRSDRVVGARRQRAGNPVDVRSRRRAGPGQHSAWSASRRW